MQMPDDEPGRLLELRELGVLDRPYSAGFQALVELACETFEVPVALASLVDHDRQWFAACMGLSVTETPRECAFCHHALFSHELLLVEDARHDERFAENELVLNDPFIRFYAGAPLILPSGSVLGTFCIIDREPRALTAAETARLRRFATVARDLLLLSSEGRSSVRAEQDSEGRLMERLAHDLRIPITSIMGFSELIESQTFGAIGSAKYAEYIKIIRECGAHAVQIIDGMLSVAKAQAFIAHDQGTTNLSDLARTIVQSFSGHVENRNQVLTLSAPDIDVMCDVPSLTVHRILNNIVSNSCKYAGAGALIEMKVEPSSADRAFSVIVTDNGAGLPDEILAKLGAPYNSDMSDGSIGLGISNAITLAASVGCRCEISNRPSGGVRAEFYKPYSVG